MLALCMMSAGLPLVAAAAGGRAPAYALDICHPAQATATASIQCSLPLMPAGRLERPAELSGMAYRGFQPMRSRFADPPPAPPPKLALR
ncbi:MAG: hypothetical protein ACREQC_12785 [Candidatus Binataceae bacterium]